MLRSLRSALARFAVRRAAASQREAPKRADLWLRLGCALTPAFADTYPALVQLRRAIEDRWGAVAAAQEAAQRFPENPDAWMVLGEAWQMAFRQQDALVAYEQGLALEERPRGAPVRGARRAVPGEARRLRLLPKAVQRHGVREQNDRRHDVRRRHIARVLRHVRHGRPGSLRPAHRARATTRSAASRIPRTAA